MGPMLVIVFLGFSSISLPLAVLAIEVHEVLGYGPVTAGIVVGIQSFATLAVRHLGGTVTDLHGPKRGVLTGLPCAAAAGLACFAADALAGRPAAALALIFASRLALGVAESLFLTGTMTWGIARLGVARTSRVMAWQGVSIYTAVAVSAPVGLALQARFGFAAVALAATAAPLLGFAVAAMLPGVAPTGHHGPRMGMTRVIGLIWRHGTALLLGGLPLGALAAFAPLYFASHGWSGAGFALTGFGVGYIGVRLTLAGLPERFGGANVSAVSLAVEAAGQVLLVFAADPATAVLGAALTGAGVSLVVPSLGAEAIRRVPPQNRGLAIGGFVAFLDISLGIAAPLAGAIVTAAGYPTLFGAGAAACILALVTVLALRRADAAERSETVAGR